MGIGACGWRMRSAIGTRSVKVYHKTLNTSRGSMLALNVLEKLEKLFQTLLKCFILFAS